MSLILSIETATPVCAVALHKEGNLLAEAKLLKDKSHSDKLAVLIDQLLEHNNIKKSQLSAVAVSEGPGSYTGLRIGVSTAKGLCFGLDIPLIAISSLTALGAQVRNCIGDHDLMIPMFDARRMEVYAQVLNKKLEVIEKTQPVIIDEDSFGNFLKDHTVYIFGDGADKCKPVLIDDKFKFVDNVIPSAASVGELAYQRYLEKDFSDVAYFEPFYLKEFRAGKPKSLI
ncbi:MAG: tRNA (adenosine(37)-N6)-threonylcarbamoyltransferase complex dimerization subunit type 1 TsaB [Candidatus Cyclobacteriaceae bacterium M2_1C_046]